MRNRIFDEHAKPKVTSSENIFAQNWWRTIKSYCTVAGIDEASSFKFQTCFLAESIILAERNVRERIFLKQQIWKKWLRNLKSCLKFWLEISQVVKGVTCAVKIDYSPALLRQRQPVNLSTLVLPLKKRHLKVTPTTKTLYKHHMMTV